MHSEVTLRNDEDRHEQEGVKCHALDVDEAHHDVGTVRLAKSDVSKPISVRMAGHDLSENETVTHEGRVAVDDEYCDVVRLESLAKYIPNSAID